MPRPITKRDLIEYIAGGCHPDMRQRIANQRQLVGSPVHKWLEDMDAKLVDPFNLDWADVALATGGDEEQVEFGPDAAMRTTLSLQAAEPTHVEPGKVRPPHGLRKLWWAFKRHTLIPVYTGWFSLRDCDRTAAEVSIKKLSSWSRDPEMRDEWLQKLQELGSQHSAQCRDGVARVLFAEAVRIARERAAEQAKYAGELGDALSSFGECLTHNREFELAEQVLTEASEVWRATRGEHSREFAATILGLAMLFAEKNDFNRSQDLHERSMDLFRQLVGESDQAYGLALFSLGRMCLRKGELVTAAEHFRGASDILRSAENKTYWPACQSNLGTTRMWLGAYKEAEQLHMQALEVRRRVLGGGHPQYALSLLNISSVYLLCGEYGAAERLILAAMGILQGASGVSPIFSGVAFCNLACVEEAKGNLEAALQLHESASGTFRGWFGEHDPIYGLSMHNEAVVQAKLGNRAEAQRLLESAMQVLNSLGPEHIAHVIASHNAAILRSDDATKEATGAQIRAFVGEDFRGVAACVNVDGEPHMMNLLQAA